MVLDSLQRGRVLGLQDERTVVLVAGEDDAAVINEYVLRPVTSAVPGLGPKRSARTLGVEVANLRGGQRIS